MTKTDQTELEAELEQAATRRAKAEQDYRAAIRAAVAGGIPMRRAAAAAGVTAARVHQIVHEPVA